MNRNDWLVTGFLFTTVCLPFRSNGQTVQQVFDKANESLAREKGNITYIQKIKPYLTDRVFRFDFRLQYDKSVVTEDSIGTFLLEDKPGSGAAFCNSQVFFYDTAEKKIYCHSIDTADNKTVNDLVYHSCHFLYQPFVKQNKIKLNPPAGFLHSDVASDSLYGKSCFKVTFWNTLKEPVTRDDRQVYYFDRFKGSLLKYEDIRYDSEADDQSVKTIDSVNIKVATAITRLPFPEFLDSLISQGLVIEYYNPYATDTTVPAVDTMAYMPDWEVTDSLGRKVHFSEFKSRYSIIDFSYLSCYYCMKSMPMLNKYFLNYSREDLSVFWIDPSDYDRKDYLQEVFRKKGLSYPVYYDLNRSLVNKYGISAFPMLFLVDMSSKNIIKKITGYNQDFENELDAVLKNLLR